MAEDKDKEFHIETLKAADEALARSERALREGRERLKRALAAYEERRRAPRH